MWMMQGIPMMKLAFEMTLTNPTGEQSNVCLVPYTSKYQAAYRKMYNECYHEMREALDIQPYDYIQDDSFFDAGMDAVHLLVENDELIGSVTLKEDELDDLIVNIRYQGRGYGRQMLLWALSHMNKEKVILHVAQWNQKAVSLYRKNGFEITDTNIIG